MPAKKKPAPKAPAKTVTKAPVKPAAKKTAKPASLPKPAPKSKAAAKPAAKVVKKAAKPVSPPKSPIVKKAPAKSATPPAPSAKKSAAKAAPAAAKKEKEKEKVAAKAPAAAKKEKEKEKESPKAVKEAVKVAAPAPVAEPAAAPAKKEKVKEKEKPAAKGKATPAAESAPVSAPANKGPLMKMASVRRGRIEDEGITLEAPKKPVLPAAFLKKQRQRLVELRDAYLNSAEGVASESLRGGSDGGDSSAFGMHQADAGSDAYDRDFALSLLAKEQDAIYEINEALKRIDVGTYGVCEMSGEVIFEERLEALPFTRFTVACQERIEREQMGGRWNRPVRSLFGLDEAADEADDDREEEETTPSNSESLDFSKE